MATSRTTREKEGAVCPTDATNAAKSPAPVALVQFLVFAVLRQPFHHGARTPLNVCILS